MSLSTMWLIMVRKITTFALLVIGMTGFLVVSSRAIARDLHRQGDSSATPWNDSVFHHHLASSCGYPTI